MEKAIKRYKYSLIACIVIILLLLFWIMTSGQLGSLHNTAENALEGAVGSIAFNKDGNLALVDNKGEPLNPIDLPLKLRGGELKFMTTISMFGVKGSPLRIVIHMGRSTYAFCIDDATGEWLPYGACD
ncbi:hypothetical protein BuS5_02516 [Desulfosarcina sp. BuS5]|uniref:hypothetical protein n=1 Tax=Desulfosarcina sp. BuS5 TaxID=933262 RepID=UPI000487F9B2|nr:hypothetical protein [Desulfosarcina sp. BuS5]WDN89548.1 hypothetical protein BuS5_02516 [Desulfosarcina sp. BuS5]